MVIQFVTNEQGKVSAVQLSLKEWKDISRKVEAYDMADSIRKGFEQAKKIEKGELKPKSLKKLMDEL